MLVQATHYYCFHYSGTLVTRTSTAAVISDGDKDLVLSMQGITKLFPGVRALSEVDFTVNRGEIHALMGENGAGKSTLIKVLTGVYHRDAGTIILDGRTISPKSPRDAEEHGISTVYQEVNLIPQLSIAENICLGRQQLGRFRQIRWREVRRRARKAMQRLNMDIDVNRELAACPVAIQQMVAIARALDARTDLLILDEPTASLDEKEVDELFVVLRRLRDEGLSIIFITHFIDQMYEISDRVTILRDGNRVGSYKTAELPRLEMVGRMIGKDIAEVKAMEKRSAPPAAHSEPFLSVCNLGRKGAVAPISMDIPKGKVIGLAGLLGSGRTETGHLIFGLDKPDSGHMVINGQKVRNRTPREAIRRGFALTPEDRKTAGIIPDLSVRENIILALQARRGIFRRLSGKEQQHLSDRFIKSLAIKTPSTEQFIRNLSGGNQQKVLLARWLALDPNLLILDEPTRGIDVGAKAEVEGLIGELCMKGMALLFISSELEEIVRSSHSVVVLRDRRKIGELSGENLQVHEIMHKIAEQHHE